MAQPLSRSHFQFLRAWAEGLDLRDAWERYLPVQGAPDLRRIRSALRAMRDSLQAVARRHGSPATAALLRRDPQRILAPVGDTAPTLEDFAAEFPEGFHSQAELLALWQQRFGATALPAPAKRAQQRRARLVQRQLDALRDLERLAATEPQPQDPTAAWLAPETAQRLAAVGVRTLAELVGFVRLHGHRWHRKVPRIGPQGAARLVAWLDAQAATLGTLPLATRVPRAQLDLRLATPARATGIVPIERLAVPAGLSGVDGTNRAPAARCRIAAGHDHAALQEWLALRTPGGHTWRAYRREAERFLLWSVLVARQALSSLTASDCVAYRRFLQTPDADWIGLRSTQRWSPAWRPFEGPLSARSAQTAETILKSLFHWLVEVRYLDSNPWVAVPRPDRAPARPDLRALSDRQWGHVERWLARQPPSPAQQRLALLMPFALATGLRESELAAARVEWLAQGQDDEGHAAWSLHVLGKGAKWREIPLPRRLVAALCTSFQSKGLDPALLHNPPEVPLFSHLADAWQPLTPVRLYQLMKRAFTACAAELERDDPLAAERLRQASPHWMRHTHGRKAADAGVEMHILQQQLGHASVATTTVYTRGDLARRRQEIDRVFG